METFKNIKNNLFNTQVGVASVAFGLAIIICAIVLGQGIGNIKRADNTISVTGSTEKIVKSDIAKITLTVSRKAGVSLAEVNTQSKLINADVENLKAYLLEKGFNEKDIDISIISNVDRCAVNEKYGYTDCNVRVIGHDLSVTLRINTKDMDKALTLSRNILSDIGSSTTLNIQSIEYFYDNLKNDRVSMLADATKNAMERATAIAAAGNSKVGSILYASSGVFQVTTVNSSDVSDYGSYDTSSIDKKVTAVVKVSFEVK